MTRSLFDVMDAPVEEVVEAPALEQPPQTPAIDVIERLEPSTESSEGIHYTLTPESADGIYTRDQIIDAAFHWFRANGFPYVQMSTHEMMQQINRLALTPDSALAHTTEAYRVADAFHPHRFHGVVKGKHTPVECFHDDEKLRQALVLVVGDDGRIPSTYFTQLGLARGSQACANFRPGFACLMYRRFCTRGDETVFDTSTGYGGRLVGWIASKSRGRYIGIDPSTKTHAGNRVLAEALGVSDRVELHNIPAEDVPHAIVEGRCDFAFTSPPYFTKEHYCDEPTQSWKRYSDFTMWCDYFLVPMLMLNYVALKPGCVAAINIADVKIDDEQKALVERTIRYATRIGFQHVGTDRFDLTSRLGANQAVEVAVEQVLVFKKP